MRRRSFGVNGNFGLGVGLGIQAVGLGGFRAIVAIVAADAQS